jgi:hypothetical protein
VRESTAIAHGATDFYVEDLPLRTTGKGLSGHFTMNIRALPLPAPPSPPSPPAPPIASDKSGQKSLFGAFPLDDGE